VSFVPSEGWLCLVREDMADVDELETILPGIGWRTWGGHRLVLDAFLDGLQEAEQESGLTVYGLWVEGTEEELAAERSDAETRRQATVAWRVRDRVPFVAGTFQDVLAALVAESGGGEWWKE
jgi:hypothetical protein